MKVILSVIAVCLVMITAKLYIPEAEAEVAGMDSFALQYDYDFRDAVNSVVSEGCYLDSYDNSIDCS